jgi:hypothetical protein
MSDKRCCQQLRSSVSDLPVIHPEQILICLKSHFVNWEKALVGEFLLSLRASRQGGTNSRVMFSMQDLRRPLGRSIHETLKDSLLLQTAPQTAMKLGCRCSLSNNKGQGIGNPFREDGFDQALLGGMAAR